MQADRTRAERDAEEIIELTKEVARLRRLLMPTEDRVERAAEGLYYHQSLAKYGRDPEWAEVDPLTREEFRDAAYAVLEAGRCGVTSGVGVSIEVASWTLVAYVNSQHPRYSKQHLVWEDGRTLCGVMPPVRTHHHQNHEGRCRRCFARAEREGVEVDA